MDETIMDEVIKKIKKENQKINAFLKIIDKPKKGIPIAIKDNFLTEGIETTAASNVLKGYIPQYSATVVKRLLKNGYSIVGKTNLDAWCHGSSTETSDFGPTLNPHNTKHLAGGSSGGSAAAVAAGVVDVAIGSETAGSIRGPASWCGVVGLKPTYGRVSRYGVIAMGSSLDSPGVLSKNVALSAKILKIIAGKDEFDSTSSDQPVDDYELHLRGDIKKLKIGLLKNWMLPEIDNDITEAVIKAANIFKSLGASISEAETIDPKYSIGVYTIIQRSEVSSNLARYDGIRYGNSRSKFGDEAKRRIMLGTHTLSAGYQDKFYKKASKVRSLIIKDFEKLFEKYDVLIAPTMPTVAAKVGVTKDQSMYGEMADVLTEPSALAGLPAISIPCGKKDNLPIGLQIIGKKFDEKTILNVAYAYEQKTKKK